MEAIIHKDLNHVRNDRCKHGKQVKVIRVKTSFNKILFGTPESYMFAVASCDNALGYNLSCCKTGWHDTSEEAIKVWKSGKLTEVDK